MIDMTQVYLTALQNALRALPDKTVSFDMRADRPWPDDGLDLLIRGSGDGTMTARLLAHDEAVVLQAEYLERADVTMRDKTTGATLAYREIEPHAYQGDGKEACTVEQCALPEHHAAHVIFDSDRQRSLVQRFRALRR